MDLTDGEIMNGTFCHWEIITKDIAKAEKFYTGLFGWKISHDFSEDNLMVAAFRSVTISPRVMGLHSIFKLMTVRRILIRPRLSEEQRSRRKPRFLR
jgi:hypothetical protein